MYDPIHSIESAIGCLSKLVSKTENCDESEEIVHWVECTKVQLLEAVATIKDSIERFENSIWLAKSLRYKEGTKEIDLKDYGHMLEHLMHTHAVLDGLTHMCFKASTGCACDYSCCDRGHNETNHLK